ncbi:MAG: hypothetical protein ABIQ06_15475 [Caldimonas sp.]
MQGESRSRAALFDESSTDTGRRHQIARRLLRPLIGKTQSRIFGRRVAARGQTLLQAA